MLRILQNYKERKKMNKNKITPVGGTVAEGVAKLNAEAEEKIAKAADEAKTEVAVVTEEKKEDQAAVVNAKAPVKVAKATEKKRQTRKRIPLGTRNILTAPKKPGFVRRFVNDKGDRIQSFKDAGWNYLDG